MGLVPTYTYDANATRPYRRSVMSSTQSRGSARPDPRYLATAVREVAQSLRDQLWNLSFFRWCVAWFGTRYNY